MVLLLVKLPALLNLLKAAFEVLATESRKIAESAVAVSLHHHQVEPDILSPIGGLVPIVLIP